MFTVTNAARPQIPPIRAGMRNSRTCRSDSDCPVVCSLEVVDILVDSQGQLLHVRQEVVAIGRSSCWLGACQDREDRWAARVGGLCGTAIRGSRLVHAQRGQSRRCRTDARWDQRVGLAGAGGAWTQEWRTAPGPGQCADGRGKQVPGGSAWRHPVGAELACRGQGLLLLGRGHDRFVASEIADTEKEPILRAYLKRWTWEVGVFL